MRAVALGVHVVDTLARPIEAIPAGQDGELVQEIRLTPAGTAGGTAVTLAKLGASVMSAGAVGEDALGDVLVSMLERFGVDTSHLLRRTEVQTSASVLPIRPDGSRPAWHVIGANATYASADAPWIAPLLSGLDFLLPNAEQVLGLTGAGSLEDGCRALVERGVGCVAVTDGAAGALVVSGDGTTLRVPACDVEVVDTTGCGDAFSAGFLRGRSLGLGLGDAARLGCGAAGLVAGGLGSDHGTFGLHDARALADV